MSAATADSIVTVKARSAPFPLVLILGGLFGVVVIALAAVVLMKGGNKNKRRPGPAQAPAQAPVAYGGAPAAGYGGPAPAYGAPPAAFGGAPAAVPLANVAPAPMNPSRAVLQGMAGVFTVVPGIEMRVGRDGATCAILLNEAQVSSFHASVKLENGTLYVRDENSNNGTFLQGMRMGAGQWAPVAHGGNLRFGPIEFTARLE